jgi:hypothetical protein
LLCELLKKRRRTEVSASAQLAAWCHRQAQANFKLFAFGAVHQHPLLYVRILLAARVPAIERRQN